MTAPVIFHIDVNSAYLSWEAVERLKTQKDAPDLRTVPSAVGGSVETRHGIIYAKSIPAKKYGIKTAEPVTRALKKCPGLIIVPPRHSLYAEYSRAFLDLLREYSPVVEKYSIDEAFMDAAGAAASLGGPCAAADTIRRRIREELGFTVNIGISVNKMLAKTASDFSKPDRCHTLWPEELPDKFWPLPLDRLLFAGQSTVKKLHNLGIQTIGELASSDPAMIQSHLGKHGELIYNYANGRDPSPVTPIPADNKCYGNSTTMSHDVTGAEEARQVLLSLCKTVCSRLRKDGVKICSVSVQLKDCFLVKSTHQKTLPEPADTVSELYPQVCALLSELWDGTPLRLLGIQTSRVVKERNKQMDLFHMGDYTKQIRLEKAVEKIRSRYGEDAVIKASLLDKTYQEYKMPGKDSP